jgi:hypothetical protein
MLIPYDDFEAYQSRCDSQHERAERPVELQAIADSSSPPPPSVSSH